MTSLVAAQISTNVRWTDICAPEATVATHPGVSSASVQLDIATTRNRALAKVLLPFWATRARHIRKSRKTEEQP